MTPDREIVVLDACVLYPAPLRDLMLSLASAGLYSARWTKIIQAEWITNLMSRRPDLRPDALTRTAELMNQAIENSLVEDFEHLIASLTLPDPDDRHVLAAAITCQATSIVTFNIKDFGKPSGIKILHPDEFCTTLYANDPVATLQAVCALRQRLKNPPKTPEQIIATFEQQGLSDMGYLLRDKIDLL